MKRKYLLVAITAVITVAVFRLAMYFLHTDYGKVVAGGLVYRGEIPLASNTDLGEVVFPLDSLKHPCQLTLTLVVGNTMVRNHWDFEVADSVR